jgi:hypothetical protein
MNRVEPSTGLGAKALTGAAPNGFIGRADVNNRLKFGIGQPKHFTDVLRQLPESFFAFPKFLVGLLALGNVLNRPSHAERLACLVKDRLSARMQGQHRTIRADNANFAIVGPTALQAVFVRGFEERPVVGVNKIQDRLVRGVECIFIQSKNAVNLVRPGHGTGRGVPAPTAEAREGLGFLPLSLVCKKLLFVLLALGSLSDDIGHRGERLETVRFERLTCEQCKYANQTALD